MGRPTGSVWVYGSDLVLLCRLATYCSVQNKSIIKKLNKDRTGSYSSCNELTERLGVKVGLNDGISVGLRVG